MLGWQDRLYLQSPAWLQNGLLSFKGWLVSRERYRGQFESELHQATERLTWTFDQHRDYARRQVYALAASAAATHPYYSRTSLGENLPDRVEAFELEQLESLPLLEKSVLRSESSGFSEWAAGLKLAGHAQTTGTTGSPLRIPYTDAARQRNYAYYERVLTILGLSQFQRHARIGGRIVLPPTQRNPPFHRFSYAQQVMFMSSYHITRETAPSYLAALKGWRPRWIEGYPSSVYALALALGSRLRSLDGLLGIVTSSSTLTDEERSVIEEAWGVPVYDHYAAAEMCVTIAQCRFRQYHVHSDFSWVELLPKVGVDEEAREIVCTSWGNEAFPLIRYRIGDLVRGGIDVHGCECDLPFPVVSGIQGRLDDYVVTPEGRAVGRLSPVAKGFPVVRLQYYQPSVDSLIVRYVPTEEWTDEWAERLVRELRLRLGTAISIVLEPHAELPAGPGGKFRNVISDVHLRDVIGTRA